MLSSSVITTQEANQAIRIGYSSSSSSLSFGGFSSSNGNASSNNNNNQLYFDSFGNLVKAKRGSRVVVSSLSLNSRNGVKVPNFIGSAWNELNRAVRFHCERVPLGFASVNLQAGCDSDGIRDDGNVVLDSEGTGLNGVAVETPKRVLILMSDTGGGHRASAEAIKAAFHDAYGDAYQVFVTDLWAEHTPWPFNQLPKSYNFLVKNGPLWKMTYYGTSPRLVHQSNFAATSAFIAREVARGLMKYQPDIIISVHPLMQHVPLRILRANGLLKKIIFTTVITDLGTCHPT